MLENAFQEAQISKVLQEAGGAGWGMPLEPPRMSCLQRAQVVPLVPVFSFSAYSKAFATYL